MDDDTESKIESLKYISSIHRKALAERISQEWRVIVLTLTYFVGIASSEKLGVKINAAILIYATTIPSIVSCGFLCFLHQANVVNKDFAHAAENSIMKYIETGEIDFKTSEQERNWPFRYRNFMAFTWQCIIIISFAIVSYYAAKS